MSPELWKPKRGSDVVTQLDTFVANCTVISVQDQTMPETTKPRGPGSRIPRISPSVASNVVSYGTVAEVLFEGTLSTPELLTLVT